jgi:hypothetical protein
MPFPRVTHCLVCEGVRPEAGGKATVLGLYGMTPDVEIRVRDLSQPIGSLCFLIFCEPGTGEYSVLPQIVGPDGNIVLAPDKPGPVSLVDPNKRAGLAFAFGPLVYKKVGTYYFVLRVQGAEHFRAPFKVIQGEAKDFL